MCRRVCTSQRRGGTRAAGGTGTHGLMGLEKIESCLPRQCVASIPPSQPELSLPEMPGLAWPAGPRTAWGRGGRGWGSLGRGAAPQPAQRCTPSASHAPLLCGARATAPSAEHPHAQEHAGTSPRSLLHPRQPGMPSQDTRVPPPWPSGSASVSPRWSRLRGSLPPLQI